MNIILIDASYTSFYRFFATKKWMSFTYPEEYKILKNDSSYDWFNNKIFLEKYEKMYLESIIKLVSKKEFINSKIYFCMDSYKEILWRSDIDCNYKKNRIDLSLKHNYLNIFKYTYNNIIPNLINNKNIFSIYLDNVEADDIIACICMYLKEIDFKQKIYIISGDEDFYQLGTNNIIFLNYKLKKPLIITENEALFYLKKKILFGDKSDCINSIFPKYFNKKIKNEVLESDEKLIIFLDNNLDIKNKYNLNKKMIDFNYIPNKYKKKIIQIYLN
jgi:5'-3' exonuclease